MEAECRVASLPWEILVQLGVVSYTVLLAWLLPAVGNQMAVVGNPLAAWVSPELLVTGLGSDTG